MKVMVHTTDGDPIDRCGNAGDDGDVPNVAGGLFTLSLRAPPVHRTISISFHTIHIIITSPYLTHHHHHHHHTSQFAVLCVDPAHFQLTANLSEGVMV